MDFQGGGGGGGIAGEWLGKGPQCPHLLKASHPAENFYNQLEMRSLIEKGTRT